MVANVTQGFIGYVGRGASEKVVHRVLIPTGLHTCLPGTDQADKHCIPYWFLGYCRQYACHSTIACVHSYLFHSVQSQLVMTHHSSTTNMGQNQSRIFDGKNSHAWEGI